MDTRVWAANNLAARLLAEPWTAAAIGAGIDAVLGSVHHRTRQALVTRLVALGGGTWPPAPGALTAYLIGSRVFRPPREAPVAAVLDAPRFAPMAPFADCGYRLLRRPASLRNGWTCHPISSTGMPACAAITAARSNLRSGTTGMASSASVAERCG